MKLTKFEDNRRATAAIAKSKAQIHGESAFSFQYRKQTVWVTATQDSKDKDIIRTRTDRVKNKG